MQEAERLNSGNAVGDDVVAHGEVPPDVAVAEGLHGEHQAQHRRADHPAVAPHGSHPGACWSCAGGVCTSAVQVSPGVVYDGCGGRCRPATRSRGAKATLCGSEYTCTQSEACAMTLLSGALVSKRTMSVPALRRMVSHCGVTDSTLP